MKANEKAKTAAKANGFELKEKKGAIQIILAGNVLVSATSSEDVIAFCELFARELAADGRNEAGIA